MLAPNSTKGAIQVQCGTSIAWFTNAILQTSYNEPSLVCKQHNTWTFAQFFFRFASCAWRDNWEATLPSGNNNKVLERRSFCEWMSTGPTPIYSCTTSFTLHIKLHTCIFLSFWSCLHETQAQTGYKKCSHRSNCSPWRAHYLVQKQQKLDGTQIDHHGLDMCSSCTCQLQCRNHTTQWTLLVGTEMVLSTAMHKSPRLHAISLA